MTRAMEKPSLVRQEKEQGSWKLEGLALCWVEEK